MKKNQEMNLSLTGLFVIAVLTTLLCGIPNTAQGKGEKDVRLVLQITIDGLRADLLHRYENGFGKGGLRHLLKKGVVFTNAHYQYANTETIVGHATLATGTFPSPHGMVGNVWFDREAGELVYNIKETNRCGKRSPVIRGMSFAL